MIDERRFLRTISLIFAIALWFYVLHTSNIEVEKSVKLRFKLPVGQAIAGLANSTITVKVKGPRVFTRSLSSEFIDIDLDDYPRKMGGFYSVTINPGDIPLPFGVELLEYAPKSVEVSLQRKISKYIAIKPKLVGEIPEELRLISYRVEPRKVMIEGPVGELRKVGLISTLPIDLSDLKGEGSVETQLEELGPRIRLVDSLEPKFKYSIRSKKANLTLKGIPIRYLSSRRRFSSPYWTVSLSVLAPKGVKERIDKSKVQVIAELPEGVKGQRKVKLKAVLPEGVHLLKIHPEVIPVKIH